MKKRIGYVSNSSSSSFICCYATVTDIDKAKEYVEQAGLDKYDCQIMTTEQAIEKKTGWSDYGADWAGVWCEPNIEKDEDHYYLVFESCGGAGDSDSDFCDSTDDWYPDYGVDFDDFTEQEREFIGGVSEETGFTNINIGYGAGRNG